jgi:hypothetical protein
MIDEIETVTGEKVTVFRAENIGHVAVTRYETSANVYIGNECFSGSYWKDGHHVLMPYPALPEPSIMIIRPDVWAVSIPLFNYLMGKKHEREQPAN